MDCRVPVPFAWDTTSVNTCIDRPLLQLRMIAHAPDQPAAACQVRTDRSTKTSRFAAAQYARHTAEGPGPKRIRAPCLAANDSGEVFKRLQTQYYRWARMASEFANMTARAQSCWSGEQWPLPGSARQMLGTDGQARSAWPVAAMEHGWPGAETCLPCEMRHIGISDVSAPNSPRRLEPPHDIVLRLPAPLRRSGRQLGRSRPVPRLLRRQTSPCRAKRRRCAGHPRGSRCGRQRASPRSGPAQLSNAPDRRSRQLRHRRQAHGQIWLDVPGGPCRPNVFEQSEPLALEGFQPEPLRL